MGYGADKVMEGRGHQAIRRRLAVEEGHVSRARQSGLFATLDACTQEKGASGGRGALEAPVPWGRKEAPWDIIGG